MCSSVVAPVTASYSVVAVAIAVAAAVSFLVVVLKLVRQSH